MMNLTIDVLKNYRIFQNIQENDNKKFLNKIKIKHINKNYNVVKEGSIEDRLIFLFKGNCSVSMPLTLQSKLLQNDDSVKEVYKASAKDFPIFGEVFLGAGKKRTANIQSTSNSIIGILEALDFFEICENDPIVGFKVMKNIVDIDK